MKKGVITILMIVAMVLMPLVVSAQNYNAGAQAPIEQPLLREGTMAVDLVGVLKLGTATNETEAERLLLTAGISPRNGWMADYPVTPDIVSELRLAVRNAVVSGSLTMTQDEASQAFEGLLTQYNLGVTPDMSGGSTGIQTGPAYADTAAINDYYYDEGPPVVTYYAPPMDYAYLYSWVDYPFWWYGYWYPGFFVLADFDFDGRHHRHHDRDDRHRGHEGFVSNHFLDPKTGALSRIDPAHRTAGGTLPVMTGKGWTNPSARRGAASIYSRSLATPQIQGDRTISPSDRGNRITSPVTVPSAGSNSFRGTGSRMFAPSYNQGSYDRFGGIKSTNTFSVPKTDSRMSSAPAPQPHYGTSPRLTTPSSNDGGGRSFGGRSCYRVC